MLFLHCALFLAFAFNISGDECVNLLVISSATLGIFVGFTLLGKVYKNWYLNALEVSFTLNLGMLAAATYHVTLSGGSQVAVAYTSVGIALDPHLCGDHHLPHLHTNQIKVGVPTAWQSVTA